MRTVKVCLEFSPAEYWSIDKDGGASGCFCSWYWWHIRAGDNGSLQRITAHR